MKGSGEQYACWRELNRNEILRTVLKCFLFVLNLQKPFLNNTCSSQS